MQCNSNTSTHLIPMSPNRKKSTSLQPRVWGKVLPPPPLPKKRPEQKNRSPLFFLSGKPWKKVPRGQVVQTFHTYVSGSFSTNWIVGERKRPSLIRKHWVSLSLSTFESYHNAPLPCSPAQLSTVTTKSVTRIGHKKKELEVTVFFWLERERERVTLHGCVPPPPPHRIQNHHRPLLLPNQS